MKVNFGSYTSTAKDTERSGSLFSAFKFPSDFVYKQFKPEVPKAGKKKIKFDILPYPASANHPLVLKGEVQEGEGVIGLDYWVHKRVGEKEKTIVCPRLTFGGEHSCPICDMVKKLYTVDRDAYKAMKAKRCSIFYIYNYETGEYEYFDTTHFQFTKPLMEQAGALYDEKTGEGMILFADPASGQTVNFNLAGKPWGGKGLAADYSGFVFTPRDYDFTETCENLPAFEDYLTDYSEEHLAAECHAAIDTDTAYEEDEELEIPVSAPKKAAPPKAAAPAKKAAPPPVEEEELEEEEVADEQAEEIPEEEEPAPTPAPKPRPGAPVPGHKTQNTPPPKPASKSPATPPPRAGSPAAGAPGARPGAPKPGTPPVSKTPTPSKPAAPAATKPGVSMPPKHANNSKQNEVKATKLANEADHGFSCPANGTIGEHCDNFVMCATCDNWDACSKLQASMSKKK